MELYDTRKPVLIAIVGTTAVGKTEFAVKMAKELDTEIISADSRQFYKDMNIGTAKPEPEEMKGVKHHFIDFLSVEDNYNAYEYEKDVMELLSKLFENHHWALLTGGSGLYVKAVFDGIDIMPDSLPEVREKLKKELYEKGLDELLKRLQATDPEYYSLVDKKNPARIIRALEIIEISGKPFSYFRRGFNVERGFKSIKLGLERDRQELYERIDQRVDRMIAKGLFAEAEKLYEKRGLPALNTVGYKEIFGFFDGHYGREEAVRLLKRNTRRYAKRQLTWFKKDLQIKWIHPDRYEDAIKYVKERI